VKNALTCAVLAGALGLWSCAPARPASAPEVSSPLVPQPVGRNGLFTAGSSWLGRVGPAEGVLLGRFEGDPYRLGAAYGTLTRPGLLVSEAQLDRLFGALIPNPVLRFALRNLTAYRVRNLHRHIPEDQLLMIAGVADGYEPQTPPSAWSAYRRLMGLHALHEISQHFVYAPGLQYACTGFVAGGSAARGHTLLARNFDFEGGDLFDREKVVAVMVPAGKIPYLSVALPGMVGVVSGFNRARIGVALHSVAGGETAGIGEPVTVLLADVLASESTFEGALERIRAARVFVSDLILLADGKTGQMAVLEKTPSAFAVRGPVRDGWLAAANDATSPEIVRGVRPLPGSTSGMRQARLEQLLAQVSGKLDAAAAVAILRDRRSASGAELGPGNRNAINALIAAHSVVFDLTQGRAYVALAPHTLGVYVPIDLEAALTASEPAAAVRGAVLPEDALLTSRDYERYREARRALSRARLLERDEEDGWEAAALRQLEEAHRLSPGFVEAEGFLAERLALDGDPERALLLAEHALSREPGPEPFRAALQSLRDSLAAGRKPKHRLPAFLEPDEVIDESSARDLPLVRLDDEE